MSASPTPSLTPSRSPTPEPPVQPDHFYSADTNVQLPPSPSSDGKTWLDPNDDPLAHRGIPVFKPTMEEFRDFEGYMMKIECWGNKSGIVKVIPPKEWTDALPPVTPRLRDVKLRNPIEQHMFGQRGLFTVQNLEKRRVMSVREWAELCAKDELRAPGLDEVGLHARANVSVKTRTKRKSNRKTRSSETAEPELDPDEAQEIGIKVEDEETGSNAGEDTVTSALASPPDSANAPSTPTPIAEGANGEGGDLNMQDQKSANEDSIVCTSNPASPGHSPNQDDLKAEEEEEEEGAEEKPKRKRRTQTREAREANLAERAAKDEEFIKSFNPKEDWLPAKMKSDDYTPEFCKELERRFWRNCGLGRPAWYGADMQGSLFTEQTTSWNVASLPSALTRLLPASSKGLPGVNTPYLYFGMWRATFAWHVEDMDLFSINYIHFGAPKYWYAVPQARATALEHTMKSYFPKDGAKCHQFLRHKSYLASPTLLSQTSCKPNTLLQRAGEFVITYPRGYHAGFNLGFNCAESVNFALESWIELGKRARACQCVNFSVRIDVEQLLRDREAELAHAQGLAIADGSGEAFEAEIDANAKPKSSRKRKPVSAHDVTTSKRRKTKTDDDDDSPTTSTSAAKPMKPTTQKVTLKLPPRPKEPEVFPCCLCVSMSQEGLLKVQDPPLWRKEGESAIGSDQSTTWFAHEECANVVPETWVDEVESELPDGTRSKERLVFGVDAIVKDRWNLKCTACTKVRNKAHGALIQCTKGKCPKAFHVSCARDGISNGIIYQVLRVVEKEVVLMDPPGPIVAHQASADTVAIDDTVGAKPIPMDVDPQQTLELHDTSTVEMHATPVPPSTQSPEPRVLKLVKKTEVQVLCCQHNPAIAEAKKTMKQEKIRSDLMALPPMARIKLRVSAGVFEVSLLRVIEESKSVEVLWDRGAKKEFKWGSVVFGSTEGVTVGQKPTELAPEAELTLQQKMTNAAQPLLQLAPSAPAHISFTPLNASSSTIEFRKPLAPTRSIAPVTVTQPANPPPAQPIPSAQAVAGPSSTSYYAAGMPHYHPAPAYPSRAAVYQYGANNWTYQYSMPSTHVPTYAPPGTSTHGYSYSRPLYQPGPTYQPYGGYAYTQAPQQPSARELQWQQPYTGPRLPANNTLPQGSSYSATYHQDLAPTAPTQQPQQHRTGTPSDSSPSPAPPVPP